MGNRRDFTAKGTSGGSPDVLPIERLVNAILYTLSSGRAGHLLPYDFPKW